MATFSYTPDFGATKKSQPAVRTAKFGDGYEQRVQFGINQNPKILGSCVGQPQPIQLPMQ
jgi:phage-related protein